MRHLDQKLGIALDTLAASGRRRSLRPIDPLPGGRARIGGRTVLNFSSNDYLGLAHHPAVIERSRAWAARYGAGATASRLVAGHGPALDALEARLAAAKGTEAALIFASGWQCNASVLAALLDPTLWGTTPVLLSDRLIHASLHMGSQAAGARQQRFRHNDLDHLAELLDRHAGAPAVVVSESVFSMDGDRPDVAALARLTQAHDALLYLDEAHATGVLGETGFGLSVGLPVDLAMGTFSKAMGSFGAYVAGSRALCDYLINRASGLIYATGLPPAVLGAIDAAVELVPTLDAERRALAARAAFVRHAFAEAGLDTGASSTHIVPVIVGPEARALALAAALEDRGILAVAIRPPTVPPGASRLRFALSAAHADADIEFMVHEVITLAR